MTMLSAEMQGERLWAHTEDFETHCAKLAINMTLFQPAENVEAQGRTIIFLPGLAAKRRVYNEAAEEASALGYSAVTIGHEGGGAEGVRAVIRALEEIDQGVVGGKPFSTDELIVIDGHSLALRKAVKGLEAIQAERNHPARDRFRHVIGHAAACLGGVRHPGAFHTVRSIQSEMRYMGKQSFQHREVAREGLEYIAGLSLFRLAEELTHATFGHIEHDIRELQDNGVIFAGVDHSNDLLINPKVNSRAYAALNIPHYFVDAPYAGHNAQLYHPKEVMATLHEVVQDMMS